MKDKTRDIPAIKGLKVDLVPKNLRDHLNSIKNNESLDIEFNKKKPDEKDMSKRMQNVFKNHNQPIKRDDSHAKRNRGIESGGVKNTVLNEYLFKENVRKERIVDDTSS